MPPSYMFLIYLLGMLALGLAVTQAQTTTPVPACVCNFERLKETDSNMYWTLILVPAICGPAVVILACLITYVAVSDSDRAKGWRGMFSRNRVAPVGSGGYMYYPEEAHLIPGVANAYNKPPKMIIASIQR